MAIEKTESAGHGEARLDAQALSSMAVARRHMLLKGLGKGSAVLAASIPLKTLASTSVFTNPGKNGAPVIRCGISGMTSSVHSADTVTNVCSGYSPGYYAKREHWPVALNPDALVTTIFPSCTLRVDAAGTALGSNRVPTLLEVMNLTPRVDEFHWIAAWVNAMGGAPVSWNFPYTGADVQAFYAGVGPGGFSKAQALSFFKTYMEIHP